VNTQALLLELLIAGFFAVACFRARAEEPAFAGLTPQRIFMLTDRLERLRRTRWQWCAMVIVLVFARMQHGAPIVAEFTALAQFLIFLALPAAQVTRKVVQRRA
jgi:hypothetical protein